MEAARSRAPSTRVCVLRVYTCAGREAIGQWQHHMRGGGVQSVGVIGLGGGAEAGGEGGSGEQLLALGGQRSVPGQGAPYRARRGGTRGGEGKEGGEEVTKLTVRDGGQSLCGTDGCRKEESGWKLGMVWKQVD